MPGRVAQGSQALKFERVGRIAARRHELILHPRPWLDRLHPRLEVRNLPVETRHLQFR